MTYTIQVFHASSGFYLNTNHGATSLDQLERLARGESFAGVQLRIVDDAGEVCHGPIIHPREAPLTIADFAAVLGVPVLDPRDFLEAEGSGRAAPSFEVSYALVAVDIGTGDSIVSLNLSHAKAHALMRNVWPHIDFWAAPGGASKRVESAEEAEQIGQVLEDCRIAFAPRRHRWHFHVSLA